MDSTKHLSAAMMEESSLMSASNKQVSGTAAPCTMLPGCKQLLGHVQEGWIQTAGTQMLPWEFPGAQLLLGPRDFCFISPLLSFPLHFPVQLGAGFHSECCPMVSSLSWSSSKAGQVALWGGHPKGHMCLTSGRNCWHPDKEAEAGIWMSSSAWKEQGLSRGPGGWKRQGGNARHQKVSVERTGGSTSTEEPMQSWSQRGLCYEGFAKQLCIFKVFIIKIFCKGFLQNCPVV